MPTYEYECKSCGHTFEVFQAMSEEPLKTCPECGKEIRRLIHGGTGVIFKGSGFYVTDKSKGSAASKTAKPADAAAGPAAAPEKSPAPAAAEKSGESAPAKSEAAAGTEKTKTA